MKAIQKSFIKYVSMDILGMIGMSAYILVDTVFISMASGAEGITALNLVLPIYSLMYAIGSMVATGSAIRFKIGKAKQAKDTDQYFSNAILFLLLFSIPFILMGIFMPEQVLVLLGADERIVAVGTSYTRIFMVFAPFFMLNYVFCGFVRNDNNPTLAMIATFASSIFNIIMDYVFMFPMEMGMAGASLATALAPVVSILICCFHFFRKKNTIRFVWMRLSFQKLWQSCRLGVSAFVGEISGGVTTMVFNFLILGIAGNIGVAAYGVLANMSLVAIAIFNGISQGSQPLFSHAYGKGDRPSVSALYKMSVVTVLAAALSMVLLVNIMPEQIVAVFNAEQNMEMAAYAVQGLKLYFLGLFCAGFNIVGTGYLSATEKAGSAFVASVLRGFIAIVVCAWVLSELFGMVGIWLAFPVAEGVTTVVMVIAMHRSKTAV
ncbi:MAG: MATE family efflux transporter [Lachnospiraceae bacterium]|nr:MATE family efflux transporter [Lachnospiraceae bacterium]